MSTLRSEYNAPNVSSLNIVKPNESLEKNSISEKRKEEIKEMS